VKLNSSAAMELLDSRLFECHSEAPEIIAGLVHQLYSPQFMTAAGPRCLSLDLARFEGDYYAYQGTGAVWPVITNVIARGLARWKLGPLAEDLGRGRLLGGLRHSGRADELWYVDRSDGSVAFRNDASAQRALATAVLGQTEQTWTASAGLYQSNRPKLPEPPAGSWQALLCQEIMPLLEQIQAAASIETPESLHLDRETGTKLEAERFKILQGEAWKGL
jgi:hypothetical protein